MYYQNDDACCRNRKTDPQISMEYKGAYMIKMIWQTKIKIGGFISSNIKIITALHWAIDIKIDFVWTNEIKLSRIFSYAH